MARNKEYETQDVLDAATLEFLEKGYKGVSVNDLVKTTRLNKHSMYQEFGNKEGLFFECIDHFVLDAYRNFGHVLRRHPLGLKNIEDFFRRRIDYAYANKGIGCLLVTTVMEKELVEEPILDRVEYHFTLQKDDFERCLKVAREQGEIPQDSDTKVLANYLFCLAMGMAVMMKAGVESDSLNSMIDMIMKETKN